MSERSHIVWTWLDDNGDPFYVGWGVRGHYHPAKALWMSRTQYDSPLMDHLRGLSKEPKRARDSDQPVMSRVDARGLAMSKREDFKERGFKLINDRPYGSRSGGGACRELLGPDLTVYESVRDAARSLDVNPSSVTRWCQKDDSGWDFLS